MTFSRVLIIAKAIIFLAAVLFSPLVVAQPIDFSTRIDSIAQAALDSGSVAGISVAVAREGEVVYARGYGFMDIEHEVPAAPETVYVIASVTKLLTAATVMQLVEKGLLSLDDELPSLLPAFPNLEQGRQITLRHLLNHTSGLPDLLHAHLKNWEQTREPLAPDFVFDYLDGLPLDFEPGTNWSYTNSGTYLAGLIIERVTGKPYGTAVREVLAVPLGLHDTFLCDDNLIPERRTLGYAYTDSELVRTPFYETAGEKTGFRGAGGFCSTAIDLARLPDALQSGQIISPAGLATMLQPTTLIAGTQVDYGLGVRRGSLDGHNVWGRTGGNRSTWAIVAHYPGDALTIVVLVNTNGTRENAWILEGRIAQSLLELGPPEIQERPIALDALSPYTGHYEDVRRKRQFLVTAEEEGLKLATLGDERPATTLVHLGNHTFGFPEAPMDRLVFYMNEGEALGYSLYYDGLFFNYRQRLNR